MTGLFILIMGFLLGMKHATEGSAKHVHAHSHVGEGAHRYSLHRHTHRKKLPLRALTVGMMQVGFVERLLL